MTKVVISMATLLGGKDNLDELVRETTGTKATAADLTIRFYAEAFEALKRWAESEEGTSGDAHENMRSASKESCWTDVTIRCAGKNSGAIVAAWRSERKAAARRIASKLKSEEAKKRTPRIECQGQPNTQTKPSETELET